MRRIAVLFMCLAALAGCRHSTKCEKEIYLIPPGFRGRVIVFFDQPDGKPMLYEGDARVYRIPDNGILKSRFRKNGGCMSDNRILFFYADSLGNRTPVDYFMNMSGRNIPKYRDYVMFTFFSHKGSKPEFVIHLVGSIYEFEDLAGSIRNLDVDKILKGK